MSTSECDNSDVTVAKGQYLALMRTTEGWEYARHNHGHGIVAALGLTADQKVVLIRQHRPPIRHLVLELPAGVAETPDLAAEAVREFSEETSYQLDQVEHLYSAPICAGLSSNLLHVYWGAASVRTPEGRPQSDDVGAVELHELNGLVSRLTTPPNNHYVDQTIWASLCHLDRVISQQG